ncbi:response regulator [Archangium sp.]|jgi:CheY-like chemotaxis protein|uniref:response regulator n=1 Tax=Archangium sp. TaxID=1872627 RepID=UPI002ED8832D
MSKNILIVESDTALSASLREALEARGFAAQETTDGKGSVELIRRDRPELVVLAVDLSAGQNGYLICGKLKKDDDLKGIPIVIIGNPDGFAQHRKLKAHADDYVAKPVNPDALVECVGTLIGFPELPAGEVVDDGLTLGGLDGLGDEPVQGEELAIEGEPLESHGDELSMLDTDNPFGDSLDQPVTGSIEEPVEAPPELSNPEDDFSGLDSLGGGDTDDGLDAFGTDDKTVVGFPPPNPAPTPVVAKPAPAPAPAPAVARPAPVTPPTPARTPPAAVTTPVRPAATSTPPAPAMSAADAAELRNLRARVLELEGALQDSRAQASTTETRVQELEAELESKSTELETAKASVGKNDQATLALREASNRKDREILRLKTELNQKEQEIVELQDKQLALETQANGATDEITRRDAQLKTLQTKADQLLAERKRVEQQLAAAKEEARGATARAAAMQAEVEQYQAQAAELEELRGRAEQLDAELAASRGEADGVRAELDSSRAELDSARAELDSARAQASQESEELRKRIGELEDAVARNEERVARLYTRIKADEKLREKTKKALAIATQLLEEQPAGQDDEEAVA